MNNLTLDGFRRDFKFPKVDNLTGSIESFLYLRLDETMFSGFFRFLLDGIL